jgi:hypothetical protein
VECVVQASVAKPEVNYRQPFAAVPDAAEIVHAALWPTYAVSKLADVYSELTFASEASKTTNYHDYGHRFPLPRTEKLHSWAQPCWNK